MSELANKLNYLKQIKEAIKQAIISKGVTVEDSDSFMSYADKIKQITS